MKLVVFPSALVFFPAGEFHHAEAAARIVGPYAFEHVPVRQFQHSKAVAFAIRLQQAG